MSVHQSKTTARPEVHGPPKERTTTAHSSGTVLVNATEVDLEGPMTLDAVLRAQGMLRSGTAVAMGSVVVPRSQWSTVEVHDGDVIEVLAASAGG